MTDPPKVIWHGDTPYLPLANPGQAEALRLILEQPGITASEIAVKRGVRLASAQHSALALERAGVVWSAKDESHDTSPRRYWVTR